MSGDPLIRHEMDLVVLTTILKSKIRLIEQKYQCALCIGRAWFYGTSFIDRPKWVTMYYCIFCICVCCIYKFVYLYILCVFFTPGCG